MYAIVRTGGKQYKVHVGDLVRIEKIDKDLGSEFEITEILMVGGDKNFIGNPTLDKASVKAVVTRQARSPKIIVFKKKRRQGYRKMQGHRQSYTEVFIKEIVDPDGLSIKAKVKAQSSEKKKTQSKKVVKKIVSDKKVVAKKASSKKSSSSVKKV